MIDTPLIIRADAGAEIGMGHVMRCLALGQAWRDNGGRVVFVMAVGSPTLREHLHSEGMEVVALPVEAGSTDDATYTAGVAQKMGAARMIVDGYHFDSEYQQIIKNHDLRLLFIDDNGHCRHYYADLLLNQNLHASASGYAKREYYTELLLGTRYTLLRREFCKWSEWNRVIPRTGHKILVTLGGSDADNVTTRVIDAIPHVPIDRLETAVVVGGASPHMDRLQSVVTASPVPITLKCNVTNMPELMAWADVAVSAGGSTCWELAFMGLPNLILVLADNQRPIAERLGRAGIARDLGWYSDISRDGLAKVLYELLLNHRARAEMSRRGRELVDGKGSKRVVGKMVNPDLQLRNAHMDDSGLLWKWANDPVVRRASFSQGPIPRDDHVTWFTSKLESRECMFFIIERHGHPFGQVRFDLTGGEAEISISIVAGARGQGYGVQAIKMAAAKVFDKTEIGKINAYIKMSNGKSIAAFEKAGFRRAGKTKVKGEKALHYVRCRMDRECM